MPEHSITPEDNVKPCPFCGTPPTVIVEDEPYNWPVFWHVVCIKEQASGPLANDRARAVELWNNRH